MNDPILAKRTIPSDYNARVSLTMYVKGGLHYIRGNKKPYFTLTADIHRKGHPNQCQSGGCQHKLILQYYPEFADLAALHLSDIDGVPTHAEANGWYKLAGALPDYAYEQYHVGNSQRRFPKPDGAPRRGAWDNTDYRNPTPNECLQIFADYVRITLNEARDVRAEVIKAWEQTRADNPSGAFAFPNWNADSWKGARQWFGHWIEKQKPRWKAEADACIARHGLKVFGDTWPEAEPVKSPEDDLEQARRAR